jgi:hypothetical protein
MGEAKIHLPLFASASEESSNAGSSTAGLLVYDASFSAGGCVRANDEN